MTLLYAKADLLGTTLQGFCDSQGTALLSGSAIPFFRAGDKRRVDVELLGWTIPDGAAVAIAGDSVLDADLTPAMAIGKDVWIDAQANRVSFILDCDYAKFYTYTANKPAGQAFYIQLSFTFVDALSGSPSGDPTQVVKVVCQANALPAVTGTGSGGGADPVYVTDEELAAAVSGMGDYTDSVVAIHNEAADAHADIRLALDSKSDVGHTHAGYVATSALGTTVATLVDGTVPLSQLPAGTTAVTYSDDPPQALGVASAGVMDEASRGDHVHPMPTYGDVGAAAAAHNHSGVYAAYTDIAAQITTHNASAEAHADIRAIIGQGLSDSAPSALGVASAGTSAQGSRSDHVHAMPTYSDVGAAATTHAHTEYVAVSTKGVANGVASLGSDAKVPLAQLPSSLTLGSATPLPLGAAAVGTSQYAPHQDHVHPMPSYTDVGAAAAAHTHTGVYAALGSETPSALGVAAAGDSAYASHANHVHAMPTYTDVGAAAAAHNHSGVYVETSSKGAANGVASLDSGSKVPLAQIPVSDIIGTANALVYKGVVDCAANPNYPAADAGDLYVVSVAGKIGGSSGVAVNVGDEFICLQDGTTSGNQAAVGAYWNVLAMNSGGGVSGPTSSTTRALARWANGVGSVLDSSAIVVGDQGTLESQGGSTSGLVDLVFNPGTKTGGYLAKFQVGYSDRLALRYDGLLSTPLGCDTLYNSATSTGFSIWYGTLSAYDAIATKSSTTVYGFSDAASAFQRASAMSAYYTKAQADAAFQPLGSYLSASAAAATYETQVHADDTYLKQADAASTYQRADGVKWEMVVPCSDLFSALAPAAVAGYARVVGAKSLTGVRGSLLTAATGTTKVTVDVLVNGSSVLATKLTFDSGETTTKTAATPVALTSNPTALADDDIVTLAITAVGDTTAGVGLNVTLVGVEA